MLRIFLSLMILTCLPVSLTHAAYTSSVKILEKKEISKLTDEQLIDAYLDAVVEIEANRSFHATSGFTPTDFDGYKGLLKYRLYLLMEIHTRNIDIPQFERY